MALSECEGICLHYWVEEFDNKGLIGYRTFLADHLVEPVICHDSIALRIGIDTVILPWSLAIDCHPVADRSSLGAGTKNDMQVTGMKPEDDLAPCSFQYSRLSLIEPLP